MALKNDRLAGLIELFDEKVSAPVDELYVLLSESEITDEDDELEDSSIIEEVLDDGDAATIENAVRKAISAIKKGADAVAEELKTADDEILGEDDDPEEDDDDD